MAVPSGGTIPLERDIAKMSYQSSEYNKVQENERMVDYSTDTHIPITDSERGKNKVAKFGRADSWARFIIAPLHFEHNLPEIHYILSEGLHSCIIL
jgi:predicted alpha/beta superfamily hydrolase